MTYISIMINYRYSSGSTLLCQEKPIKVVRASGASELESFHICMFLKLVSCTSLLVLLLCPNIGFIDLFILFIKKIKLFIILFIKKTQYNCVSERRERVQKNFAFLRHLNSFTAIICRWFYMDNVQISFFFLFLSFSFLLRSFFPFLFFLFPSPPFFF